ncbi:hypothetical protein HOK76_00340 [archaeon]|nr:hypothetical protein [archaeon]MBT4271835.1 hypothetical protein [archaeon]MBT4858490.1 hypothetical protein [archaeon]MBT5422925.1 hypothetical protein [archaeon]
MQPKIDPKRADLEAILKAVPQIRNIINKVPLDAFKEDLRQKILSYTDKQGVSLQEKAVNAGRGDEFLTYVDHLVDEKYSVLYGADYVLGQIEHVILGIANKKPGGLGKITMKFAGRTVLLPAYLATYAVHKVVDDMMGQWSGLYSRDLKGQFTYQLDDLIRQVRTVGDIAGITTLVDGIIPGSVSKILPGIPQRIGKSAIRDANGWIETGQDPSPGYSSDIKSLIEKMKGLRPHLGKVVDYHERFNQDYSADHVPASSLVQIYGGAA